MNKPGKEANILSAKDSNHDFAAKTRCTICVANHNFGWGRAIIAACWARVLCWSGVCGDCDTYMKWCIMYIMTFSVIIIFQRTVVNIGYFQQPATLPFKNGGYNIEPWDQETAQGMSLQPSAQPRSAHNPECHFRHSFPMHHPKMLLLGCNL